MEIIDFSKQFNRPACTANHAPFFPANIFAVIAGSTGSGKTNLMLNFLLGDKILDYGSVYVYSSTLFQPAYEYLKRYYTNMEENIRMNYNIGVKIAHFFDVDHEIQDPSELDSKMSHVMIFDDVMLTIKRKSRNIFAKV